MNQIPKFEHHKDSFEKAMNRSKNTAFLISREIKSIEQFVFEGSLKNDMRAPDYSHIKSVFDIFKIAPFRRYPFREAFENYLIGESVGMDEEFNKNEEVIASCAFELAKYHNWLKAIQDAPNKDKKTKIRDLTLNQKLLALHYLGMDFNAHDNSKLSTVLSSITGQGKENIRKSLSYIQGGKNNKVRTETNLKEVKKLFGNAGIIEVSDKIGDDIDKL